MGRGVVRGCGLVSLHHGGFTFLLCFIMVGLRHDGFASWRVCIMVGLRHGGLAQ